MIDSVVFVERPGLEHGSSENLYVFQGPQIVLHLAHQLLMHMKHMEKLNSGSLATCKMISCSTSRLAWLVFTCLTLALNRLYLQCIKCIGILYMKVSNELVRENNSKCVHADIWLGCWFVSILTSFVRRWMFGTRNSRWTSAKISDPLCGYKLACYSAPVV